MTHQEMADADNFMTTCLKPHRDNLTYRDVEEWKQAVAECLEQAKSQVHPSAFEAIQGMRSSSRHLQQSEGCCKRFSDFCKTPTQTHTTQMFMSESGQ